MVGETLAQVDQRDGRGSSPRNIQGQVGHGFKQPGLWKVSLSTSGKLDWMTFKGPFQPKPLYDSTVFFSQRSEFSHEIWS